MSAEVEVAIVEIIVQKLGVKIEGVTPDARLVEDLGADSLNILDIALEINEIFEIEIAAPGLSSVRKVADLYRLTMETFELR
ncbi:phosphopantetheine-binding protein [Pseudomonas chlororaphis subsp. aurantiaca]|uniref:phosphopantetheine-binding protein n=1 Tax=Pseudomonas chlororaphis TaxID=587753 RepID=UPI0027DD6BE2|nr:phosphopantetheine-binding protein [Pseudomonas chlororaphis]WMI97548.1 phosphopantetheine-binding protein [Pseudomonas chlororaphis subsp. aurantiaca]